MVKYSQNQWSAYPDASIHTDLYTIPGGTLRLRKGNAGKLLAMIARAYHEDVEPLEWPGNWGYAYRDVVGGGDLSNHASGTAIDLNAPQHPLGTSASDNFTSDQRLAIRRILNACHGTIRWGGDYVGRQDPMHFEINTTALSAIDRAIDTLTTFLNQGNDDMPDHITLSDGTTPSFNDVLADIHARTNNLELALYNQSTQSLVDGTNKALMEFVQGMDELQVRTAQEVNAHSQKFNDLNAKLDNIANTLAAMMEHGETVE